MKGSDTSEKQFYLNGFRHRGIMFHVDSATDFSGAAGAVLEELKSNQTTVVICAALPRDKSSFRLRLGDTNGGADRLAELATELLASGSAQVRRPSGLEPVAGLAFSLALAARLGIHKVVVVDPRGSIGSGSRRRAFINAKQLAKLCRGKGKIGEWDKAELRELFAGVRAGLASINIVEASALGLELFTYSGAGTLLTAQDYCTVSGLGLDDFNQAARLLARGEREGYLLARDDKARARLMLSGFGAWFEDGRLAGVAGLETERYRRSRLGEVVGLYTITRFHGGGVGVSLLKHLAICGRKRGLKALFACTHNDRAAEFFDRNGYAEIDPGKLPRAKWAGRSSNDRPRVFWQDLAGR